MILPTGAEAKGQLTIEVLTPSTDTARLAGEVVDSAAFKSYETDRQLMISRFGAELKNEAVATKLPDAQRVAILEKAAAFISGRYG